MFHTARDRGRASAAPSSPRGRVTLLAGAIAAILLSMTCAGPAVAQDSWVEVTTPGPSPRYDAVACYDPDLQRIVLVGGFVVGNIPNLETWVWDGLAWTQLAVSPPGVHFAVSAEALAYDRARGRLVLFASGWTANASTWELEGNAWVWKADLGPAPRHNPGMAYDSDRNRIVLFGGNSRSGTTTYPFGDLWEWDGVQWTDVTVAGPDPRYSPVLQYDSARQTLFMAGGSHQIPSPTTWGFSAGSWTLLSYVGAYQHNLSSAYDDLRSRVIVSGGLPDMGEPQQWNGSSWSPIGLVGDGLPARARGAMVYFPPFDQTMIFGGASDNYATIRGDTWVLSRIDPAFDPAPQSATGLHGGTITLTAGVVNLPPNVVRYWRWQKDGVPLSDGNGVAGATTSTLRLEPLTTAMSGTYELALQVSNPSLGPWISPPAQVSVTCPPPTIGVEPLDEIAVEGAAVTFTVGATGCGTLSYQWRKNSIAIPGATQAMYTIPSIAPGDAGTYQAQVSDGFGSVLSRVALLNVPPGPVFQSISTRFVSAQDAVFSWILLSPARCAVEYGGTAALGQTTALSPEGVTGEIVVSRGGRARFFYRLRAIDDLNQVAITPIRELVFPSGAPRLSVVAVPPRSRIDWISPGDGIPVGIVVQNAASAPVFGRIEIVAATLANAPPRDPSGALVLPRIVAPSLQGLSSVRMVPDLVFSRSEMGAPGGAMVVLSGTLRWYASSLPGSAFQDVRFSHRFRLP